MVLKNSNFLKRLAAPLCALAISLVLCLVAIWICGTSADAYTPTRTPALEPAVVSDPEPVGEIKYITPDVPDTNPPTYPGTSYEALVPATLDLAERARLSINALTSMTNPKCDHEMYFLVYHMANPPTMTHMNSDLNTIGKYLEVLPLLRTMCGSMQNVNVEYELMRIMLKQQGSDGMIYMPASGRPWSLGPLSDPNGGMPGWDAGIDQVGLLGYGPARTIAAFLIYGDKDPKGPWREAATRLAEAMKARIIVDGPNAYTFKSWTYPGEKVVRPERLPGKDMGILGGMSAWVALYLAAYDRAVGDPDSLAIAEKMVRYNLEELKYFGDDGSFSDDVVANLGPGGKSAHFHTHAMNILAAVAVAQKTGNKDLLNRAKKAFEWAASPASTSEPVVGFFPEVIFRGKTINSTSEVCEVSDMIIAGMMLSQIGDDHWDDVDRWVRNQLAESQLTRIDWLSNGEVDWKEFEVPQSQRDAIFIKGQYTTDRVAERTLGAFSGWPSMNDWVGQSHPDKLLTIMNCCSGSGARALYAVWQNMISFEPSKATTQPGRLKVHLLLNRASKWADIDSYIPYEGRVDIKAKQDLLLDIRMPQWASQNDAKCAVDGKPRTLKFDACYAQVGNVKNGQTVSLTFPISERTEKVHAIGKEYTVVLRGNDVVSIDPPGKHLPFYQRAHYRTGVPLYRKVTRFVSDEEHPWW